MALVQTIENRAIAGQRRSGHKDFSSAELYAKPNDYRTEDAYIRKLYQAELDLRRPHQSHTSAIDNIKVTKRGKVGLKRPKEKRAKKETVKAVGKKTESVLDVMDREARLEKKPTKRK